MVKNKRQELSIYEYGKTTLFACQYDQRFSYFAYIPSSYQEKEDFEFPLTVIVHGTGRTAQEYRDAFADYAEKMNSIILAPVFPAGIAFPEEVSSYKFIQYDGIHYDDILFAMIDEISDKYRIKKDKFLLHGFSGGGHFTHRFLYLHPERLLGASIGAPGRITYIDSSEPWYVGIKDFEQKFGKPLQLDLVREIPVQMVVGQEDVEIGEINDKNDPFWMDGFDKYGKTRVERLKALRDNYQSNDISVQFDLVPGVKHEGIKVVDHVKQFFTKVLEESK